jgi:aromatic ring hydroxylase
MKSKEEFLNSLVDGRKVYYRGKLVENVVEHPVLKIAVYHAAKIFDYPDRIYEDSKYGRISKFFKIPRNTSDLLERHELIYNSTMYCNGVFNISQAIGSDALSALMITTKKLDKKYGTDYYKRVEKYYQKVIKEDLTIALAQTDVKGDRAKRPSEQVDPDLYLRVVDVKSDGIIVRGAKAHTTQSIAANEIIVLPTRAMREADKDYAISFAVPVNTEGVKLYARPVDELEGNSSAILSRKNFEVETLTVFEDVFVPWERVFLFREFEFAGQPAVLFATFHRFTAISYRAATLNLYLGATIKMAEANGILKEKHVREDILEIIMCKEIMRMGALAAALKPILDEEIAIPNPIFTNIAKLYSNSKFPEAVKALIDIAGGIIATIPSEEDLQSDNKEVFTKYLRGAIEGRERIKIIKFVKELAGLSSLTGYMLTLMAHAEGSVEASKLELERTYDFNEAIKLVDKILSD